MAAWAPATEEVGIRVSELTRSPGSTAWPTTGTTSAGEED
jgi:hypothetical protein